MYSSTLSLISALDGVDGQLYSFFNLGARWGGWSTSRPGRRTPGKDLVPIVYEAGWVSGPDRTGAENLPPPALRFDSLTIQQEESRYTDCTLHYFGPTSKANVP